MYNPPSSGLWSPPVRYPPGRSPGVLSASSRGRGCPIYRPVLGAQTPQPPQAHPNPAPRPRGAGAEQQAWARPRVGNKGAQAKRVTHRTRTGTRAPGVADPAGPGAGLKPSWVSTLSLPRLGGGTISVPWGHAATFELGRHSGPWGLQPHQRTDVRDPQECAEWHTRASPARSQKPREWPDCESPVLPHPLLMRPQQWETQTHVHTCTHLCIHVHTAAWMRFYTVLHACICIHVHPHAHTCTCTHPHRTSGQGWSEKGVSPRSPQLPFSPEPLLPQLTGLEPQQEGVGLQTSVGKRGCLGLGSGRRGPEPRRKSGGMASGGGGEEHPGGRGLRGSRLSSALCAQWGGGRPIQQVQGASFSLSFRLK